MRTSAARRIADEILARKPEFCLSVYARLCPFTDQTLIDWLERLRAAGLPEERQAASKGSAAESNRSTEEA